MTLPPAPPHVTLAEDAHGFPVTVPTGRSSGAGGI
jgi:hypothetical protein